MMGLSGHIQQTCGRKNNEISSAAYSWQ